jgi:hypothetical protein
MPKWKAGALILRTKGVWGESDFSKRWVSRPQAKKPPAFEKPPLEE